MKAIFIPVMLTALLADLQGFAQENSQVQQLIGDLKSNEAVKKRKAVKEIARLGISAKAANPYLISVLDKDRDVLVRRGAAEALGVIGGDANTTIPALARALKDSDVDVIAAASVSLRRFGKKAVPALREALSDKDNQVRRHAADALAGLGVEAKDAVPDLIKAYQSEAPNMRRGNVQVKASYINALGEIGPDAKDAIPILKTSLADNRDRQLRRLVTDALRKIEK